MAQYKITVGKVSIETDDLESATTALVALAKGQEVIGRIQVHAPAGAPVKKQRKHNHKKVCPDCSKEFRGLMGLGIHRAKSHGIPSPVTAAKKNQQLDLDLGF